MKLNDGASGTVLFLRLAYRGFTFTPKGTFIGLLWALPDGFVGGALVAWIYNCFAGAKPGSAAS